LNTDPSGHSVSSPPPVTSFLPGPAAPDSCSKGGWPASEQVPLVAYGGPDAPSGPVAQVPRTPGRRPRVTPPGGRGVPSRPAIPAEAPKKPGRSTDPQRVSGLPEIQTAAYAYTTSKGWQRWANYGLLWSPGVGFFGPIVGDLGTAFGIPYEVCADQAVHGANAMNDWFSRFAPDLEAAPATKAGELPIPLVHISADHALIRVRNKDTKQEWNVDPWSAYGWGSIITNASPGDGVKRSLQYPSEAGRPIRYE